MSARWEMKLNREGPEFLTTAEITLTKGLDGLRSSLLKAVEEVEKANIEFLTRYLRRSHL